MLQTAKHNSLKAYMLRQVILHQTTVRRIDKRKTTNPVSCFINYSRLNLKSKDFFCNPDYKATELLNFKHFP